MDYNSGHDDTVVAVSSTWHALARAPRISVIVPVFNTARYLDAALGSLVPHDHAAIEVIVVHDGGTDNSLEIAKQWVQRTPVPALLTDQVNAGLSAARMTGLRHARGEAIGFLDSDDIANAEVLLRMAIDITERNCDIVLARSIVLDGASLQGAPFYDSWLWDDILGGQRFRRVTLAQEPRLLRLEPNANTRVLRHSFLKRANIQFPIGRLFEDPPAHVRGIVRASAIGLSADCLYLYRVNRPGKITDERSLRRFDSIETVRASLEEALSARVSDLAGANLLLASCRLLFWCCQNVSNPDKQAFASAAIRALREAPDQWFEVALQLGLDRREAILFAAWFHGDPAVIAAGAAHGRPRLGASIRFVVGKRGGPVRELIEYKAKDAIRRPWRRIVKAARSLTK